VENSRYHVMKPTSITIFSIWPNINISLFSTTKYIPVYEYKFGIVTGHLLTIKSIASVILKLKKIKIQE